MKVPLAEYESPEHRLRCYHAMNRDELWASSQRAERAGVTVEFVDEYPGDLEADEPGPLDALEVTLMAEMVNEVIDDLEPTRLAFILRASYGLLPGGRGYTYEWIGKRLHVTRERVRTLLPRAMRQARFRVENYKHRATTGD